MIFQALAPSTEVFAQELDAVMEASVSAARAAGNTARSVQDAVATALQDADQATSDDATTTPDADAGATEGGDGSTNAGESQDSTTDGTTNGDAPAEGDASQDDAAADEGAADEEQADDADADAADQADATYAYNTAGDLEKAGVTDITTDENGKVTKIVFRESLDLIKISNTNPTVYQDAKIEISGFTGGLLDATVDVTEKDKKLEFRGFGSSDVPFKGSLDLGTVALAVKHTLFNNIELSNANKNVVVTWKGTDAQPIVAAKVLGNGCELNANITVATDSAELKSPLLGEVAGAMPLKATYSVQGGGALKVAIEASSGNVGLLVNTLAESASLSISELGVESFAASTIKATAEGCNAGGLIGECAFGSTVTIDKAIDDKAIDLSAFSVIGKAASGGLIGKATNLKLNIADGATVKPARNVGDESSACSGGVIGDVSFARKFTVKPNMFDLGELVTLGASQRAGALFGVADISNGDIVVKGGTYKSKLASGKDGSTSGSYGGLVGKVFATAKGENDALRALVVQRDPDQNDADKNKCAIEFNLASGLSDAGGVVGHVGDNAAPNPQPVAIVLNGVKVACKGDASVWTSAGNFGGAVGVVDARDVLDVRGFTLTSENAIGNVRDKALYGRAAGIAGSARNAVIKFSGITDLSGASFAENSTTGQLVYDNNNALIFAAGDGSDDKLTDDDATSWAFKRSIKASKTDDIATYGEVIRLGSDFIKLDTDTHKLTLPDSLAAANGVYTLTSVEDFAKLAITWQTNGCYSLVDGVTENNLNVLQSSTITVNGTIDLKGTGLTGFTQDRADGSQVFSGTLNGGGTINLAVGEPYGVRDKNEERDGSGKIYRHGRLGLFAAVNGATISNVTIAGSMKFDNQSNVDAGALAGVKVGGDMSLTSAKFSAGIEYESTRGDNYAHVGGMIGGVSGAGSVKIGNREFPSVIEANIISKVQEQGTACVGGAVGYVDSDCVHSDAGKTVEVDGLTISGSIAINHGSSKTYAGGFIGKISQGGVSKETGVLTSVKQVEITKINFVNFNLETAGKSAINSAGLLGYSWGGAEVTLGDASVNKDDSSYAITTSGSSISSATATEFGGLVYAASGHWVINNYALNLSGVTLSAPKANKFGMLVCRAGSGVSSAVESLAGLYLENRAPWATAYVVNTNSDAITTQATVFDEWVADGCNPKNAVDDCGANGVVSLHTQEEKLHMTDDGTDAGGARNSYENRTVYGKQHQANGLVRYYYNLDRAVADIKRSGISKDKTAFITKPQELLVWSVSWYAPKALRPYVWSGEDSPLLCYGIGRIGAWDNDIQLDMTGYSYYPIDITGMNTVVRRSIIKFCFSDINKKESKNKQNSQSSQHMNMHAGLFSSYSGSNSVTIHSVTLQGSIGSASGGTGVLFTKFVKGDGKGAAKVEIKDLTLDGIKVDGAKDATYAPLLINRLSSKTSLTVRGGYKVDGKPTTGTVQGITVKSGSYKKGEKAATSLFGNLGDEKAEMVTANFQDITVPSSKTDGIFTHASLLESFAYDGTKSGSSASYIFYSKKHKEEDSSFTYFEPTYGAEIDTKGNDSEYAGQQRWYNDEKGYMTDGNLVTDGSITANEDTPQFASKYLPYVYKSKEGVGEHAHDTFHEIKVNQRVSNLLTGCGTYGDPYTLTNAAEVVTVANYINGKESAADGWQIAVIDNQENLCTRREDDSKDYELIYEYKRSQGSWVCTTDSSKTLSNDTMHSYIQSAYYSIEPADSNYIELDGNSFKGFGNKENPFRGVIVGDLKKGCGKATLKIVKKTRTISGLIPYSYGCVVKDLNVEYSGSNTISYVEGSDGIPSSFFGGVIGCILGGDNIIDGVVVNNPNNGSTTYGFTVTGSSYLVPIGGYVGTIAGGGVIFRHKNERKNPSWRAATRDKSRGPGKGNFGLYDNPYVGRVIDGYAFSEGEDCTVDNGDANYKINKLKKIDKIENKDASCVIATAASGGTAARVTPTSAQGLLVLSAIINSGAASGGVSLAYEAGTYDTKTSYRFGNARYGKVRNATYKDVGNPASVDDDFKRSTADDLTAPGFTAVGPNLPYLVNSYADVATGSLCASSGVELQLASNATYNMTSYGRGFTGLSGRYVSNACVSSKGVDRDCIVPRIACINGNGATVTVNNKTREYVDDDYCVAGVGGLFNTITFVNNPGSVQLNAGAHVKDLTFYGCNISLVYISSTGAGSSISGKVPNAKDRVGIGCLAGSTANKDKMTGVFKCIRLEKSNVSGGSNAGGLIGTAGWMGRSTNSGTDLIVDAGPGYKVFPVQLYDCSYSELKVASCWCAGGFVGSILSGASGISTTNDLTVASDSRIAIEEIDPKEAGDGCMAGGFFGLAGGETYVNTDQGAGSSQVATIKDVTIAVNHKANGIGCIVGRARKQVTVDRVMVTSAKDLSSEAPTYLGSLGSSGSSSTGYTISAGGIAGVAEMGVTINSCTVEKIHLGIAGNAGGLIGSSTSGQTINCSNTVVRSLTFDGSNSGCISGEGKGKFHLANVLLDSNTFNNKRQQGILLGNVDTKNLGGYELCAAGISVKLGKGQTNADMPALIRASNNSKIGEVNNRSYVAFGDYGDTLTVPDEALYNADAADGTTAAVAPYVTTNPVSSLSVLTASGETGQTRYLFGDGVNVSGAKNIKENGGGTHYAYTNYDGGDHWNYSSSAGEFNKNNDTEATKTDANPDVLVLSGNDSDTVKDYLNLVTNGGYSDALRLNAGGSHVSATVDVFQLENGVFVKQTNVTDQALDVKGSGSSLSISANSNWDNGKGRFNLLTVTFTEAGQSYRVMVPIIVKRVFEINFTATYSEGSNFNSVDYRSKYNKHVLISSGETMTGYLTWTYNKAYTQETEYGWDTHLASGGDMRPLNKRIEFGGAGAKGALPAGTQLTLVDTAHNSKEYHYTVPTGESATSVALTDFEDSSRNHYTEQWLSETMGATATDPKDGSGLWVKLTNKELTNEKNVKKTEAELIGIAGAKIDGDYYRLKTDADTEGPFYNLTVPKKRPDEQPKSESFYLVVRTPKGSANVNGYTGTSVTTSVNTHLNYTLREDEKEDSLDSHENTASTYSVATNFRHNLVDNISGTNQMTLEGTTYSLDMNVSDTITFGEQEYTSTDALYYQLDSSLVNYENHSAAGAHGYPTGTQGTYSFYVMVGKDYYAPHASTENGKTKWTWEKTTAEDPCAATTPWAADGADMKLTLADAKLGAIDLSGIREIAKSHDKQFTITMKANLTMTEPACQAGIIASQKGDGDKYTKPNYRACLSTDSDTLSTSSNSAYNDGGAGYYRMDVGSSTIALEASKKSRLGINIDDLKSDDGEIALVGTYDFSKLAGADAMISSANKVTYTLSLQQRQDTGKYAEVSDISKYITVLGSDKLGAGSLSGNSYVFTDNKTGGKFATLDDNSLAFTHAFRVKVNTDVEGKSQTEGKSQKTYAHYRLVLTANMTDGAGNSVNDTPVNVSNLAGYEHSDYVTYTLARINTKGIPHGTNAN